MEAHGLLQVPIKSDSRKVQDFAVMTNPHGLHGMAWHGSRIEQAWDEALARVYVL